MTRNQHIAMQHRMGCSKASIAREVGLSRLRVIQIILKYERQMAPRPLTMQMKLRRPEDPFED